VPGLTWPTVTFEDEMSVWFGEREIRIWHPGAGHTAGDTVAWLPKEKVLFSGDLVEEGATPYCGDAHLQEWPRTLEKIAALGPRKLVPGRGEAMTTPKSSLRAIDATRSFPGGPQGREIKVLFEGSLRCDACAPQARLRRLGDL
jgi:glyoxylase-like metal-dependent hydrolase (beta-lactamase superfamily II)